VTVIEAMKAMGKDDPELAEVVLSHLRKEGIEILEGVKVEGVERTASGVRVRVVVDGAEREIEGTDLLVATGRRPNIEDLNLEAADVRYERRGITVNSGLVTSNRRVFAIGDVTGGLQFTHVANYHAGIVIRRALFRLPVRTHDNAIPWVTYTDPELAHIGLTEDAARKSHGRVGVLRWPYHENDRAQAERKTDGLVKVVTSPKGTILGATIVGESAGELIQMWSLAVSQKLNIKAMTEFISPYPTLSEINKRAAYTHFLPKLTSPFVRGAVRFLSRFG
jgi:pyruvate/2-oxoglutarate dehydrogenase complex dihydrolipoamide dehydrogenase (E3) component